MSRTANPGARLDRLSFSSFHQRIFFLIGAGMFFDGYDLYVGTTVLGSTIQGGFSTLNQNAQFVSLTFLGMAARGTLGRASTRSTRRHPLGERADKPGNRISLVSLLQGSLLRSVKSR